MRTSLDRRGYDLLAPYRKQLGVDFSITDHTNQGKVIHDNSVMTQAMDAAKEVRYKIAGAYQTSRAFLRTVARKAAFGMSDDPKEWIAVPPAPHVGDDHDELC